MKQIAPCWILSFPKTGSTYLCNLLNSTGLFQPLFSENYRHMGDVPPRYNKLFPFHHVTAGPEPARYYPDTRYVLLRRRDLVAMSVSTYFRNVTNINNVSNRRAQRRYSRLKVPFSLKKLVMLYHMHLKEYHFWSRFVEGKCWMPLYYEDLTAYPRATLTQVMDFIGVEPGWTAQPERVTLKMRHPKKKEYTQRLADYLTKKGYIAMQ